MTDNQSGISLVETLVVVGMVGLLATLIIVMPPSADNERQAGEMADALRRAARISTFSGTPVALAAGPDGQRFERYSGGVWKTIPDMPAWQGDAMELIGGQRDSDGVRRLIFTPGGRTSGGRIRYGVAEIEVDPDANVVVSGQEARQ